MEKWIIGILRHISDVFVIPSRNNCFLRITETPFSHIFNTPCELMSGTFPAMLFFKPTSFSFKFTYLVLRIASIVDSGMKVIPFNFGFCAIPLIKWMLHIRRSGPQFEITITLIKSREENAFDKLDKVVVICSFINSRFLKGSSTNVIKRLLIRSADDNS